jgi:hemerythrin
MSTSEKSKEVNYGAAAMEREHSAHLGLLNDLKAALRSGAPDSLVYALLDQLVEHTNLHFISEQLAMKLHAYEAYESHFLEHRRLTEALQDLKRSLPEATATDKQKLIEALRSWLLVHIQTADKALAEHLNERGLTTASEA